MENKFSPITMEEYVPVIKRIFTFLQIKLHEYPELEERDSIRLIGLEPEIPLKKIISALSIVKTWIEEIPIQTEKFLFRKTDPSAKWSDLLETMEIYLTEYENKAGFIDITITQPGVIKRKINGIFYECSFENTGKAIKLIRYLVNRNQFTKIVIIYHGIGCKNAKALSELKRTVNETLCKKLNLPKRFEFIVHKRGSGYMINPSLNIIKE
ncbi:MAG: hypothetical protein A2X20_06210 [Bacteroidetes bacterium GWE2_40_15]|nr:MAG: hypothetical protein A2X20_06210 [Bacteroidetes bacterium GWE2_40_15]